MADDESSALTEQQERFCRFIVEGLNQTDAYKAAGYKAKSDSVAAANASRLIGNAKIQERLSQIRKPVSARAQVTLEWLIEQAQDILQAAMADSSHAASIAAVKELGILSGARIETRHNLNQDANEPSDLSRAQLLDIARAGRKGIAAPGDGAGKPDSVHPVH
jgi:phage terminase small subunit